MPTTYKLLGSATPDTTGTTLYTVPAGTQTVASSLIVTNLSAAAASFSVAIKTSAGGTLGDNNYIAFNTNVPANDSVVMALGLSLSSSYVVLATGSTAKVAFNLFGAEIS